LKSKFEKLTLPIWHFVVAIEESSAEGVLAADMLVADVLVLADDCTQYISLAF
jgi:hypothetical protein